MTDWPIDRSLQSPITDRLRQALIVTHELAKPELMNDFFARKLHPLEPVLVYGRSYKADPPCKACASLWWGWKDLGRSADRSARSDAEGFFRARAYRLARLQNWLALTDP